MKHCLAKLEAYVTKVTWSIKGDKFNEDVSALESIKPKSKLLELIANEVDEEMMILEDVDKNFISLKTDELIKLAKEEEIENLKRIANKFKNETFNKDVGSIEKAHKRIHELEDQLALEKQKNTYFRTSSRALSEDAKGLVHNIKLTTKVIKSNVDTLYDKVRSGKLKDDEILERLGTIRFNAEKALKISTIITRAGFNTAETDQIVDLVKYISQYVSIYSDIYEKSQLKFELVDNQATLKKKVSVLDVSVIFDDLISNSEKAGAKQVLIEMTNPNLKTLQIVISDDGKGIPKKFIDMPEEIFELGVTTTDGSGIGLHSVRTALKKMGGDINFIGNNVKLKGASFKIIVK